MKNNIRKKSKKKNKIGGVFTNPQLSQYQSQLSQYQSQLYRANELYKNLMQQYIDLEENFIRTKQLVREELKSDFEKEKREIINEYQRKLQEKQAIINECQRELQEIQKKWNVFEDLV